MHRTAVLAVRSIKVAYPAACSRDAFTAMMPRHISTTQLSSIFEVSENPLSSELAEESCRAAQGQQEQQRPCLIHVLIINPPPQLGIVLEQKHRALRIASCSIDDPSSSPFYGSPLCAGDVVVRIHQRPATQFRTAQQAMAALHHRRRVWWCGGASRNTVVELTVVDYKGDRTLRSTTIVWNDPPPYHQNDNNNNNNCITLEPERDYWNLTSVPRRVRELTKLREGSACVRVVHSSSRKVQQQ